MESISKIAIFALFAVFLFWLGGKYGDTAEQEMSDIAEQFRPVDDAINSARTPQDCTVAVSTYLDRETLLYMPPLKFDDGEFRIGRNIDLFDSSSAVLPPEVLHTAEIAFTGGMVLYGCLLRLKNLGYATPEEISDFVAGTFQQSPSN